MFHRDFEPQRLFGWNEPMYHQPRPKRSNYEKKTIKNMDDGRIIVKTVRKKPGRPWEKQIEEYQDEKSYQQGQQLQQGKKVEALEQGQETQKAAQQQSANQSSSQAEKSVEQKSASKGSTDQAITQRHDHDVLDEFNREFRELSDGMARDFDSFFGTRSLFDDFWGLSPRQNRSVNWFEPDTMMFDPENTAYQLKTVINNNGNVTVKTAIKEPGGDWQTSVKQYSREKSVEGSQKQEAISEGQKGEQKQTEKTDKEQVDTQPKEARVTEAQQTETQQTEAQQTENREQASTQV